MPYHKGRLLRVHKVDLFDVLLHLPRPLRLPIVSRLGCTGLRYDRLFDELDVCWCKCSGTCFDNMNLWWRGCDQQLWRQIVGVGLYEYVAECFPRAGRCETFTFTFPVGMRPCSHSQCVTKCHGVRPNDSFVHLHFSPPQV